MTRSMSSIAVLEDVEELSQGNVVDKGKSCRGTRHVYQYALFGGDFAIKYVQRIASTTTTSVFKSSYLPQLCRSILSAGPSN